MKKILSVLLTCIMILTMIPAAAFADETAATVTQLDFTIDEAKCKIDTALTEAQLQTNINAADAVTCAQAGKEVASIKMTLDYRKDDIWNPITDYEKNKVSAANKYAISIYVTFADGYKLPSPWTDIKITINGKEYVREGDNMETGGGKLLIHYIPDSEKNKITDINASFTSPHSGENPSFEAVTDSSDYTVTVNKWYHSSNVANPVGEMKSDAVFQRNELYICELKITPAAGKTLALDNLKALVNGGTGYVADSSTADVAYIRSSVMQCPDTYRITVNGGTTSGYTTAHAAPGGTVKITASVPEGKAFDKWVATKGNVIFADAASAATTFTMPASEVEITAQFKEKEEASADPDEKTDPAVPADPGTAKNISDMTIKLSASALTYNGLYRTPVVTATDSGMVLVKDTDYTVSYSGNKYVGTANVTITGIGAYTGAVVKTFKINPTKVTISNVKKAASGKMKVTWKKHATQTTGFQVQYSTSSTFKSAKTVTVSGSKATTKTISKLKKGKKYYVRVRSYKTVNGTKYYSSWSAKKSVRV